MFQPAVFHEDRLEVMQNLIRSHPFATLVTTSGGRITADHVPLVLDTGASEQGILRGHIAAANPLFDPDAGPLEAMAVFQGPQHYITPSWYASKAEHGKVVPTWNYAVVHVRGTLAFVRDAGWLARHLNDLTQQQEGQRPDPWAVSDAPDDFVARQIRMLAGIEITVTDTQGKWKVSQNRSDADRDGVVSGLSETGSDQAAAMSELVTSRRS